MKKRVKIDSSLLSLAILFTVFLYPFPRLYPSSPLLDNILDFLGFIVIFKGAYIRMSARGVKKANSQQGEGLVKKGLYTVVRNPMYLGSFTLGAGFILVVWPFWILPVFAVLFYLRFNKQIVFEEKWLLKKFGKEYEVYCREVPRLFPSWKSLRAVKVSTLFPWKETWSTKEKRALLGWPFLAVVLESLQEWRVFGSTNIFQTVLIFLLSAAVFFCGLGLCGREQEGHA
ncbi:MAG TPA: isoprenylcysteine carboxylmethyltransferase family protein [Candidatus Omnitrophota bacterium]|nr:isoprenylcysteine carboxylmethyltransferase family protein [Candidatus Omnitrophota bacterium]HPB67855.1 isoprenylcysteine carboxylmethyltransferase family protein [Candidatus Omnitrophota bacterium]HQO57722.1 isoprenylcysteine carboxylmethyltransferase family protein [Candidatus Omnitrophota bacterium]HQP11175.1 isoprenylcysteine carboxylmethyltransferase family protein [Candidatus Omnitrophota bacterium]